LSSSSLFLFFNELSSSLFLYFFKLLVFLLISSNPNVAYLCQPCSPPSSIFYLAICYSQKHILSSSSLFLFFNESSFSLFPYFSSLAHRLPYFFNPLVFLLISSNLNATRLCQPCSPPSFVFYMAICYSQKHIFLSSSLFHFFNESSSSLFPYFSLSAHRLPYFFKPLVFLLISSNPNATRLCQPCSPTSFVFYMAICYSQKHILSSSSLFSSSTNRLPLYFLIYLRQHIVFLISSNPNATRLCQPCLPLLLFFTWLSVTHKSTHLVIFLLISLLQRVVFFLISLFLFVSTSFSLFLQTLGLPPYFLKP
jgi:hypothetical protein